MAFPRRKKAFLIEQLHHSMTSPLQLHARCSRSEKKSCDPMGLFRNRQSAVCLVNQVEVQNHHAREVSSWLTALWFRIDISLLFPQFNGWYPITRNVWPKSIKPTQSYGLNQPITRNAAEVMKHAISTGFSNFEWKSTVSTVKHH